LVEVVGSKARHPKSAEEKKEVSELLRRYLRLTKESFRAEFDNPVGELHPNVLEAMKSILGDRSALDLRAVWLLGLGVYRSLVQSDWKDKWDSESFRAYPNDSFYAVAFSSHHTEDPESDDIRLATLRAFTNLCERLFLHDTEKTDILIEVDLEDGALTFNVDIGFDDLRPKLTAVFRRARGERLKEIHGTHDTSTALLNFYISAGFVVDGGNAIDQPHGPLNVGPSDGGTYVRFGKPR
jgi:hypothetical protein